MTENQTSIVSNNAATLEKMVIAADTLYNNKEYLKALNLYNDILLYTSNSDIYVKMGNCYNKTGDETQAIEFWQKAIELDSMNSDAFINIGNTYYLKNDYEHAISFWMAALVAMPEEPTANLNLAVVYTLKEMPSEAYKYYERYLKYAQNKNSDKYKQIHQKIEKNKKLADNYLKLGYEYQCQNDRFSALKCYKRAEMYYPNFSKIPLNIGSLYYADNNFEEAVKYWTKAFYLDSSYSKILCNLAVTYDSLQKYDYAYCYYNLYLNKIANNPDELSKVSARCLKIKPYLNANPYLIENHLRFAQKAFSECNYVKAINEFNNYIILNPNEKKKYSEIIYNIESYLYPEYKIIKLCQKHGNTLFTEKKFKDASKYFARILILSENGSVEFTDAKRKLTACIQHSL